MARWTDLAEWRGPSPNVGGQMVEHRGIVLHIAEGYYEGTISWQLNRNSSVSSHFILGRQPGQVAQMVDTDLTAWTQRGGNGHWLSIEFAGFTAGHPLNPGGWEVLTDWQIQRAAEILYRAHRTYGVPLRVTDHPGERGLGHHSMDREWLGEEWGHDECPGPDVIGAKAEIVRRAIQIAGGSMDLETRNKSYVRTASGEVIDDHSVGHQFARNHGYAHRLVAAMFWGSDRYDPLDTVAMPGTEEAPRPADADDDGRRGASWRYAIQRIWRWAYWTYRRMVGVDERTAAMQAQLAAQGELLARIAEAAGVGNRDELIEQAAQRAKELISRDLAADVAEHLEIRARDDQDGREDLSSDV